MAKKLKLSKEEREIIKQQREARKAEMKEERKYRSEERLQRIALKQALKALRKDGKSLSGVVSADEIEDTPNLNKLLSKKVANKDWMQALRKELASVMKDLNMIRDLTESVTRTKVLEEAEKAAQAAEKAERKVGKLSKVSLA